MIKHFISLKMSETLITEEELLNKAHNIAGLTLKELAIEFDVPIPQELKQDKGWIGKLIEKALDCYSTNEADVDYPHLGIELKTIPIDPDSYKPLETTWVCMCPLTGLEGVTWKNSHCRHKLKKVLFIPISRFQNSDLHFSENFVGQPILWQMSNEQDRLLGLDFEELIDLIVLGGVKNISAKNGTYLQLRGKTSKTLVDSIDEYGNITKVKPLAFYLKTNFTQEIIDDFLNNH